MNLNRLVERFGHVIHRQSGDAGGGQRLHFDAGLRRGGRSGHDAHASFFDGHVHVGMREHEGMAERDQLAGAFGGGDAGDARDLQGIALRVRWELFQNGGHDAHEGVGARRAAGFGLGRDVDHAGAAGGIVVRELLHLRSTRMSSPRGYSARSGPATR